MDERVLRFWVRWTLRFVRVALLRRCRAATDAVAEWHRVGGMRVVIDGRPSTVAEMSDRLPGVVRDVNAEQGSRELDPDDRLLRIVGFGLAFVNAGGFVVAVAGLPFGDGTVPPLGVIMAAAALATLAIGTQTVAAVQLGRRLWTWRHLPELEAEVPSRDLVVVAGSFAVLVTGLLVGAAFYRMSQLTGSAGSSVRQAIGLALAASAVVAPWTVVASVAYRRSPARSLLAIMSAALAEAERLQDRHRQRAARELRAAEHLLSCARVAVGSRGSDAASAQVAELARAVAGVAAAYREIAMGRAGPPAGSGGPDGPPDPEAPAQRDDLDLAG